MHLDLVDQEKINILLIEDNPEDADYIQEILSDPIGLSCDLRCADRLSIALENLGKKTDVILLDLSLPDSQGFETFHRVRDQASRIPIVVLTGFKDESFAIQAVQNGAQDYLVKSDVNANLLTRSIRYAIERKRTEERLIFLANYDALTQLPNRVLFNDRLNQSLVRLQWRKRLVAVLFIDLDHFKRINDTLGHIVGDELLKEVSQRFTATLREGDTVARLGGDEFAVILTDVAKESDVSRIAQKFLKTFKAPFLINGYELSITASIGISLYPHDGVDGSTILKNADVAMYRSKEQGRNHYQFYHPEMNANVYEQLSMEIDLRHAIERNELRLLYQPQWNLKNGRLVGMEALVRWNHPKQGNISPAQFIPLAEDTGLIVPIGEWILERACHQNQKWQEAGYGPICMAVNISGRQFQYHNLVGTVKSVIHKTGLSPQWLELELTESIIQSGEKTVAALRQLNRMGVRVSIDDFGTGYSSLSYLKRLPIQKLKIDQSFVRDITTDPDNKTIVTAIVLMAHSLNLKVIAEAVETIEQLEYLRSLNCHEAQGFLLSRPLPDIEATRLLAEEKCIEDLIGK